MLNTINGTSGQFPAGSWCIHKLRFQDVKKVNPVYGVIIINFTDSTLKISI